jgi:hypothetical protein
MISTKGVGKQSAVYENKKRILNFPLEIDLKIFDRQNQNWTIFLFYFFLYLPNICVDELLLR